MKCLWLADGSVFESCVVADCVNGAFVLIGIVLDCSVVVR